MTSGRVRVAFNHGVHIMRLLGDVRLDCCSAFEHYLSDTLAHSDFTQVIIDLSMASGVDSTTLGQLAKISIHCRKHYGITPTLYSPNPDITRILLSMGFEQVFHIVQQLFNASEPFEECHIYGLSEEEAREQVISAHRVLMSLNEKNKDTFRELVNSLESDQSEGMAEC